jgi:drug/metabolite transporter (DMT)-like permease
VNPGIAAALVAALLFGASTPLAKALVGDMAPLALAGLLYAGSGLGLAVVLALRMLRGSRASIALPRGADVPWLAGAVLSGGIVGPFLLMIGLQTSSGAAASLLLNLEGVLTALVAWFAFRENFDRRIALGMALIVAGGAALAIDPARPLAFSPGALAVVAACACWALDNNLTRKVAASDAVVIACVKGLVAGATNLMLAGFAGLDFPSWNAAVGAAALGFFGYGVSLALFVVALRALGAARTGAYFSVGPFFGALVAVAVFGEPVTLTLAAAGALMAWGVWLHATERHEHAHVHEPLAHAHPHVHDAHHRHAHADGWDGAEPHTHWHRHEPLRHRHAHYPDLHHRHRH